MDKSWKLVLLVIFLLSSLVLARFFTIKAQSIKCFTRAEVSNACFTANPKCLYIFEKKVYAKGLCTQSATDPIAWKIGAHKCDIDVKYCHPCGSDITNIPEFTTPTNIPYNQILCTALGITNCTILELHKNPLLAYFSTNVDGFLTGESLECPEPSSTPTPSINPSPNPMYTINNLINLIINYAKAETSTVYPDGKNNLLDVAVIIRYL